MRKSPETIVCYRGVRHHSVDGHISIEYLNRIIEYEYGNREDFVVEDVLKSGCFEQVEKVRVTMPTEMSNGKATTFTDINNHHYLAGETDYYYYDPKYEEFDVEVLESLQICLDTDNKPHLLTEEEKKERFHELFLKGYPEKLAYPDAYLQNL